MVFFNLLNFFTILLEFSITHRVGTERNGMEWKFLFSLFLSVLQPILAWNGAIMVFFNFLNFLLFFLEFSISHQVGTKRIDNFHFPFFSAFSDLFWLEMNPKWYFLIFWTSLLLLEFSIRCRVGLKRTDNFYFFSFPAFSNLFRIEMKP